MLYSCYIANTPSLYFSTSLSPFVLLLSVKRVVFVDFYFITDCCWFFLLCSMQLRRVIESINISSTWWWWLWCFVASICTWMDFFKLVGVSRFLYTIQCFVCYTHQWLSVCLLLFELKKSKKTSQRKLKNIYFFIFQNAGIVCKILLLFKLKLRKLFVIKKN